MNVQEAYNVLQENCGIKVGDQVRVLRIAKDDEMGWKLDWDEWMDEAIGNIYEVIEISPIDGILLNIDDNSWYFPFFVLEKIEGKDEKILEVTMQEVEDKFGCEVKIVK